MSKYDYLLARPVRTMKHNGKVRTLEGNEHYEKIIQDCIDDLYTYMPAQQFVGQIRAFFIKAKKIFQDDATFSGKLLSVDTSYGKITVESKIKSFVSTRAEVQEILRQIDMFDKYEAELEMYVKHVCKIDTSAVKLDIDVISNLKKLNTILDYNIEYCEVDLSHISVDEIANVVKLVASRAAILKNIYKDQRKYLEVHKKLKETFIEASNPDDKIKQKKANFPTYYEYRGVTLAWDSLVHRMPYPTLAQIFLVKYDCQNSTTMVDKYKNAAYEISKKNNRHFVHILLDNIDYLSINPYEETEFC